MGPDRVPVWRGEGPLSRSYGVASLRQRLDEGFTKTLRICNVSRSQCRAESAKVDTLGSY